MCLVDVFAGYRYASEDAFRFLVDQQKSDRKPHSFLGKQMTATMVPMSLLLVALDSGGRVQNRLPADHFLSGVLVG